MNRIEAMTMRSNLWNLCYMKIAVLGGIALICFGRAGYCQDVSLSEGEAVIKRRTV